MTPTSVLVSIRAGNERMGWVHPFLCAWLLSLLYEKTHRIHFNIVTGIRGLAGSANVTANGFMDRPEFSNIEWLCIVDNDTVPPENLIRILDDVPNYVDIISPLCHMTFDSHPFPQQGFYRDTEGNPTPPITNELPSRDCSFHPLEDWSPGLHEIDRVGGGCWFIRRRVFEGITKPYFKVLYNPQTYEIDITDDVYFQDAAKKLGFRLFCDTRFMASHYHTLNMAKLCPEPISLTYKNNENTVE